MEFLGGPPRLVAAIFPKVVNDETHVLKVTNPRLGVAKPKTFRVHPDQRSRPLDEFGGRRGRRRRRRQFTEFIWRGSHAQMLVSDGLRGNH